MAWAEGRDIRKNECDMNWKEENLSHADGDSERKTRPAELEEGEEMHPLVFRLLKKCVDPAVVPVHLTQGAEVADHTSTLVCKGGISASSQASQILRTRDRDHDYSSPFLEQRQQSPERWLDLSLSSQSTCPTCTT